MFSGIAVADGDGVVGEDEGEDSAVRMDADVDLELVRGDRDPARDGAVDLVAELKVRDILCAVGDGDTGKAVPEFVWVQTLDAVFLCEVLQVTGRTLGMYRLGTTFLGEYILADGFLALLKLCFQLVYLHA